MVLESLVPALPDAPGLRSRTRRCSAVGLQVTAVACASCATPAGRADRDCTRSPAHRSAWCAASGRASSCESDVPETACPVSAGPLSVADAESGVYVNDRGSAAIEHANHSANDCSGYDEAGVASDYRKIHAIDEKNVNGFAHP